MNLVFLILAILSAWLLIITVLTINVFRHIRGLSKEAGGGNLIKILEKVLIEGKLNANSISQVKDELVKIEDRGQLAVQKIGLLRFNPFEELGGEHSFSLALLNGVDTGIIITGLHTRERTRVYIKQVVKGKPGVLLSNEEKKALKIAQKVI